MMKPFLFVWLSALALLGRAGAQGITCNTTSLCPASNPCCSEFGFCGDDHFCLGGCNPLASNTLNSCRPSPICKDANHTFADNSRILTNSTYFDGNASAYDWVVDKGTIMNTNSSGGELAMLLTQTNGGTRLSSTRYLHYGTVTTRLKTGKWGGVVTAFITMSDIKDEIDWEFPGTITDQGQTNFFWQGSIPAQTAGETSKGLQDTSSNYHDFTIDWQPKVMTFSVDGKVVRVVNQADHIDSTNLSRYPNTPSRIQLSIWPAGINTSAPGTVQWAGGMINWNDPDYTSAGHFYALVKSVSIKCADPQIAGPNMTTYVYGANLTSNTPSIAFSNKSSLLNSAQSTIGVSIELRGAMTVVSALIVVLLVV